MELALFIAGILLGAFMMFLPIYIYEHSSKRTERNIYDLNNCVDDLSELKDEVELNDEQFKVRIEQNNDISNRIANFSKKEVSKSYLKGKEELIIDEVRIEPESWVIIYRLD